MKISKYNQKKEAVSKLFQKVRDGLFYAIEADFCFFGLYFLDRGSAAAGFLGFQGSDDQFSKSPVLV
jgi:hypothetical protein